MSAAGVAWRPSARSARGLAVAPVRAGGGDRRGAGAGGAGRGLAADDPLRPRGGAGGGDRARRRACWRCSGPGWSPAASCATSRRSATAWARWAGAERDVEIETAARDELAELAAAANAMIAELRAEEAAREQSESARRDLVAAVSHDLRTPITSLRLLAEAVGDDIVDDDERRGVPGADADPHRRPERADRRPVRALPAGGGGHQLVAGAGAAAASWWGRPWRRCGSRPRPRASPSCSDVPDELGPARANPEKLQRVLFNLIQNAIRHTPADGSVVVRAEPVASRDRGRDRRQRRRDRPRRARARVHRLLPRRRRRRRGPATAPGSAWRCPGRSSRPTAGRSGWPTRAAAGPGCGSACCAA